MSMQCRELFQELNVEIIPPYMIASKVGLGSYSNNANFQVCEFPNKKLSLVARKYSTLIYSNCLDYRKLLGRVPLPTGRKKKNYLKSPARGITICVM